MKIIDSIREMNSKELSKFILDEIINTSMCDKCDKAEIYQCDDCDNMDKYKVYEKWLESK